MRLQYMHNIRYPWMTNTLNRTTHLYMIDAAVVI